MPKAPSKYNPYKFPELAKFRRDLVLRKFYENNFISKKEMIEFKDSKLKLKEEKLKLLMKLILIQKFRRNVKEYLWF